MYNDKNEVAIKNGQSRDVTRDVSRVECTMTEVAIKNVDVTRVG